jgi:hypothetical protein
LLLAGGLAAGWRRPPIRVAALAMLVAALAVTVWPGGFTLWKLAARAIPGLSATRAMTRLGLALPVLAGAAMATLVDRAPRRARLGVVALCLLAIGEQSVRLSGFDKRVQEGWVSELASRVEPTAAAFAVTIRRPGFSPWIVQLDAMWAGLGARRPTVNGYSGNWAPGWGGPLWTAHTARPGQRDDYARALEAWLAAHDTPRSAVQWIDLEPRWRRGRRFGAPPPQAR